MLFFDPPVLAVDFSPLSARLVSCSLSFALYFLLLFAHFGNLGHDTPLIYFHHLVMQLLILMVLKEKHLASAKQNDGRGGRG